MYLCTLETPHRNTIAGGGPWPGNLDSALKFNGAAAEAGIPDRTLQRAKDWFGVRSHRFVHRKTKQAEWYWYDPDAAWPKDFPWDRPYEPELLPYLDPLR